MANLVNLNLAIFTNLANLANLIPAIFANFANLANFRYPKTRKYFTETKIFIKISIVVKTLFQSVREKIKIEKVVHEKLKLNVVNQKKNLV